MTDAVITHADNKEPTAFTQKELGWLPWLEPLPEGDFSERHRAALVDATRIKSAYFRLLARDPDILEARTRTDKDIFYNVADGLPRAERELALGPEVLLPAADRDAVLGGQPGRVLLEQLHREALPSRGSAIAAHTAGA